MKANKHITKLISLAFLPVLALFFAACGASAPVTPVQIPSAIEFAGGDVTGDIPVRMGNGLSFIVKDADGVTMTVLPSGVTAELYDPISGETIPAGGVCGSFEIVDGKIVYTAPDNWNGIQSRCGIRGIYDGQPFANVYTMKVSLSPTVAQHLNFVSKPVVESASYPNFDIDPTGNLFVCYSALGGVYFTKSDDAGDTWSRPVKVHDEPNLICSIEVSDDLQTIAIAGRYSDLTEEGFVSMTEAISFSINGGSSFAPLVYVYPTLEVESESYTFRPPVIAMDSNNVVHYLVYLDSLADAHTYVVTCTAGGCVGEIDQTDVSGEATSLPSIAIGSDNAMSVVWANSSELKLNSLSYANGAYQVGTPVALSGSSPVVSGISVIKDKNDAPVVSWMKGTSDDPYAVDVYVGLWEEVTSAFTASRVSDVDSSVYKFGSAVFVTYDNYKHVLYKVYQVEDGEDVPYVYYTLEDDDGAYSASKEINIDGFALSYSSMNLKTDLVGRAYIIWNSYDYVTHEQAVHLSVGTIE